MPVCLSLHRSVCYILPFGERKETEATLKVFAQLHVLPSIVTIQRVCPPMALQAAHRRPLVSCQFPTSSQANISGECCYLGGGTGPAPASGTSWAGRRSSLSATYTKASLARVHPSDVVSRGARSIRARAVGWATPSFLGSGSSFGHFSLSLSRDENALNIPTPSHLGLTCSIRWSSPGNRPLAAWLSMSVSHLRLWLWLWLRIRHELPTRAPESPPLSHPNACLSWGEIDPGGLLLDRMYSLFAMFGCLSCQCCHGPGEGAHCRHGQRSVAYLGAKLA